MTKEEIIDAGIEYTMNTRPVCIGGASFEEDMRMFNRNPAFEAGAEWMKKKFIDKACEWLEDIDFEMQYQYSEDGSTFFDGGIFIEDFRKAMEE